MYLRANDLIQACEQDNKSIAQVTLEKEQEETGAHIDTLRSTLAEMWDVMTTSATKATIKEVRSLSGMTGGNACKMQDYTNTEGYCDPHMVQAMAHALSVSEWNANMGRIVAAPTGGAAGILPAALLTAQKKFGFDNEAILDALVVASAIGGIISANATVSGAEGGCQVECGSAAAMAAAALVSLRGGNPACACEAAGFALISVMGLVCDPIGGLVEFPCALRNASGVVNAMASADMALAGMVSIVPFDEVVEALYQVGQSLPYTLRETALGGLAATDSAMRACKNCNR